MLFSVLRDFGSQIGLVIALCAFVYALNHITFGPGSVVAKLPTGLIYTLLFYFSGLSIVIPILAHATQNLALLTLARSRGTR
jgi:membrane protease YdiL (CAAX protease family)